MLCPDGISRYARGWRCQNDAHAQNREPVRRARGDGQRSSVVLGVRRHPVGRTRARARTARPRTAARGHGRARDRRRSPPGPAATRTRARRGDRLRTAVVRALQRRAERGRADDRRGHLGAARQHGAADARDPGGRPAARGPLASGAGRVRGLADGGRADRGRSLAPRTVGDLGRGAVHPRGVRVRTRDRDPEAGAPVVPSGVSELRGLRRGDRGVPRLGTPTGARGLARARVRRGVDGVPRHRTDRDRLRRVGVRARSDRREPARSDDLRRTADVGAARMGGPGRDPAAAGTAGRSALPGGDRDRAGWRRAVPTSRRAGRAAPEPSGRLSPAVRGRAGRSRGRPP